ncbi:MAG: TRAP transporter large permease [Proteobacteria bacterium]|nr:TRAP transporter large permease [Pseudomonadota bacterium]
MSAILIILIFLALCAANVPIAVALGAVALGAMALDLGTAGFMNAAIVMFEGARKFPLIAIPLFVLAGGIMNATSISRRLIAFCNALIGFVRGGLAMVSILASMFFAEISGSAVADVAALGSVLIPEMKKRGYSKEMAASVMSSAASLAIIIPPSIPMILYAVIADTSVVKLFVAGIVPGVCGGLLLMAVAYWQAIRQGLPAEAAFRISEVARTLREASLALLLPVIILGGIFGGVVTATEGAALAVVAAIGIGLLYRELDLDVLYVALVDGVMQTAVVMLLVATSALLGVYLTETQLPQRLAGSLTELTRNPILVLALLNIAFFVLGFFLHGAAAIILVVPIVMPLIKAIGIDPIHFGIIVTLNIAVGQQTPPVASVLMIACSIAKANMWEASRINVWFVVALILVLLLVTYVPFVSLALVDLFY